MIAFAEAQATVAGPVNQQTMFFLIILSHPGALARELAWSYPGSGSRRSIVLSRRESRTSLGDGVPLLYTV